MWYAGIDWSDSHHDIVVIDEAGHRIASKHVAHTKAGLDELISLFEDIIGPHHKDQLACIVETNRGCSSRLCSKRA